MQMVKDGEQEKRIAAEIDDFFLQFTEILWAHISSYYKRDKKTSLNITEHFIVEFLGKESFASMSKLAKIIYVAPNHYDQYS